MIRGYGGQQSLDRPTVVHALRGAVRHLFETAATQWLSAPSVLLGFNLQTYDDTQPRLLQTSHLLAALAVLVELLLCNCKSCAKGSWPRPAYRHDGVSGGAAPQHRRRPIWFLSVDRMQQHQHVTELV